MPGGESLCPCLLTLSQTSIDSSPARQLQLDIIYCLSVQSLQLHSSTAPPSFKLIAKTGHKSHLSNSGAGSPGAPVDSCSNKHKLLTANWELSLLFTLGNVIEVEVQALFC